MIALEGIHSIIRAMGRLYGRLLTVLMALLLGLAPLQGVLAAAASSLCQGMAMSQMDATGEMSTDGADGQAMPVCDNCCGSDHCANGHCASCLPAIALSRVMPLYPSIALDSLSPDTGLVRHLSSPLYRPPRA